ncbi:MAG: Omp28-related outer membrane protein [Saprospiraceae bacterium]|nr:Omp28-related outer membrane protein [Saprospiraceae bacterium]
MKRRLLLVAIAIATASWGLLAQTSFSDDFESYTPGDLIAQTSTTWTTWGGGGTADDAPVSSEQAFSGNNSLKLFSETTGGGPADVVLPFGGVHTEGTFTFDMMMYVQSGTGGYFNFQAVEPIGTTWALEVYIDGSGGLVLSNTSGTYGDGVVPQDEWFNINFNIDLTANSWNCFVNGDLIASFNNPVNSLSMLDLFPVWSGGTAHTYVDDISFEHNPPMLPDWDAAMSGLNMRSAGLTGQELKIAGTVKNTGVNTINSVDLTWSDGTNSGTETLSGLNLASLESADFVMSDLYSILDGAQVVTVTVSNPNGETDMNDANDSSSKPITGYTPAPYKGVLIEEATGTWCGWCPRGAVFMDSMSNTYPDHFVGVAVHNGDPMTITEYDNGMTSLPGFSGFPSVAVERDLIIDPSQIESYLLPRVTEAPLARLANVVEFNETSGELTITVQAEALSDFSGDNRLNVVIIENGVTGTGSGYNQANYYSGGGAGPMGGYENLPGTIPAAQMTYNEVGRAILGGYQGTAGSLPGTGTTGETYEYTYSYVIPAEVNVNNIEIVSMFIMPNGEVDNALETGIEGSTTSVNNAFANHMAEVFPNPFTNELNIRLALSETVEVEMILVNSVGSTVASRNYGQLYGNPVLTFDGADLAPGVYFVHLRAGDKLITKKVQLVR